MKVYSVLVIIVFILETNVFSQVQFTPHTITTNAIGAWSVYAIDVDGDGDMDVLSTAVNDNDKALSWYENDGNENFTQHTIATTALAAESVYAVDVDGDGDMDVLSTWGYYIYWFENDGNKNFTPHQIPTYMDETYSVYAADVDGDGDMDVLSASWDEINFPSSYEIAWYENDGEENFTRHRIEHFVRRPHSVYSADVDGDGDMDVLSASRYDPKIAWYENDGNENFTRHKITTSAFSCFSVSAVDIDSDGDMDVLSASFDNKILWYENDGNENFTQRLVTTNVNASQSVYAIDVDGDGDMDVLSASVSDDKIAWCENDGNENFTLHTITTNADFAMSVYAIDVDGDGDMDLLSASFNDNKIAWYENLSPVGVDAFSNRIPTEFGLTQNYPNPFNPSTKISYQIPELSFITLRVYDVLGNEITALVNKEKQIGSYEVKFDATGIPSGVYFYRLQAEGFAETKKMVLIR